MFVAPRKNEERVSVRSRTVDRVEQLDRTGQRTVFLEYYGYHISKRISDILFKLSGTGERNSIYAVPSQESVSLWWSTCSTMLCGSWSLDGGEVAHGTQCSVPAIPTATP